MIYLLGALAGLITTLSPCVLPVLPFVARASSSVSRWAPMAMGLGMLVSFTLIAFSVLSFGSFVGLDESSLKFIGSVLIIVAGLSFLISGIGGAFGKILAPLGNRLDNWSTKQNTRSVLGQFFLGTLIGLIWSPCTGPTLGAAVGLAAHADTRVQAFYVLFVYSLGAIVPLMAVAYATRSFMSKKLSIHKWAQLSRKPLGALLVFFGVALAMGWDKVLEIWFLEHMPDFWVDLITRF